MRAMPLVSAVVYLLAVAAPSAAGPLDASVKNIRARDSTAALLLRFGLLKSAHFREIVETLERSKVIVYVEVRQESQHPVGGGLTFIGESEGIRWVRATVDSGTQSFARTCQDIVRLTSILGHELQHAREASQAASMRDVGEFERYFRSIGVDERPRILDTLAARRSGSLVAEELRGRGRPRSGPVVTVTDAAASAARRGQWAAASRSAAN